jgi:hypothetical protein
LLTSVVSSSQELTDFSFLTPLEQIDSAFQNIFAVQTSQQNNQRFQITFYTCFKHIYFTFISPTVCSFRHNKSFEFKIWQCSNLKKKKARRKRRLLLFLDSDT